MRTLPTFLSILVLLGLLSATSVAAQNAAPPGFAAPSADDASGSGSYGDAQVISVRFGAVSDENGLRLLSVFADGLTEPLNTGSTVVRRTLPGTGPEQFFYLDIDDTYLYDGINEVQISVQFYDQGFAPIYLDYDSINPEQPHVRNPDKDRKRATLTVRGNTGDLLTATLNLKDARLAGGLGGADFRIGSASELRLLAVAVWRKKSELPPSPVRVILDGDELQFTDAMPFIARDRVLIPVRAIFEGLGAQVTWHGETRTVEAHKGSLAVQLAIENRTALVNGRVVQLDVPAVIISDRTYVPLRFVAEAFGSTVAWDGGTGTVTITSPPTPVPAAAPSEPQPPEPPEPPKPTPGPEDPAGPDLCRTLPWWAQPSSCLNPDQP